MNVESILEILRKNANPQHKKIYLNHGAKEPVLGVSIAEIKKLQKQIGKNQKIAFKLYATGILEAMYLAGLIAESAQMSTEDIHVWVQQAKSLLITEHTIPVITAAHTQGLELAQTWIKSKDEHIASAGWATLSKIMATPTVVDCTFIQNLLNHIVTIIHQSPSRVSYTMNGFIIAVGIYRKDMTKEALEAAAKIGKVHVDMGHTSCKVPAAKTYILKAMKIR